MKIYYLCLSFDYKPYYVGSTMQDLKIRRENHMSETRGNRPIVNWIKELRKNNLLKYLKIVLIEETTKELRYVREEYWTKKLSSELNVKIGVSHSEESKAHLSKKLKGRKMTEEQRIKINKAQQKKALKVIINNILYPSIKEASRITGLSAGFICSCCKGDKIYKKGVIKYGNG